MKSGDRYLKWVEWSQEDGAYVGRCPDLFFGGCDGDDPLKVYAELSEIVDEVVTDPEGAGKPLPEVRTRPLVAV